ncbi:MAG: PilZ domain-containing protein [Bdellovibrionales bacterium]|nr:PilZ domain-containing protein [Oligoflexia bacterium]
MPDEKRKLPRFHITPCQFHESPSGRNFSIQDISEGGLAIRLFDRGDVPAFAVGTEHHGLVKVEGLKLECTFKVKYIRGTLIGAEWLRPDEKLSAHLKEISHPIRLGEHLKKYDLPELVGTVWFHNPVGVDLLFYPPRGGDASAAAIGRWVLYIHQTFVQWEMDTGVKTGEALAEDDEGYAHGIVRLETRLIEYDETRDQTIIDLGKELIQHAHAVGPELRNLVSTLLKGVG